MNNRTDIWRRLQEHPTPPPTEVRERLMKTILFETIREHSTPPPKELTSAIQASIGFPKEGKRRFLFLGLGLMAAALVLVLGAVLLLKPFRHAPAPPVARKEAAPAAVVPVADSTVTDSAVAETLPAAHPKEVDERPAFYMEGHHFPLVDNDLLVTFTSFSYPEMLQYLDATERKVIRAGLYTGMTISPQLMEMIHALYDTRSDGKPSKKARKMKKRLEEWKKADEKRFDKGAANPADPFDLGDFIFKY